MFNVQWQAMTFLSFTFFYLLRLSVRFSKNPIFYISFRYSCVVFHLKETHFTYIWVISILTTFLTYLYNIYKPYNMHLISPHSNVEHRLFILHVSPLSPRSTLSALRLRPVARFAPKLHCILRFIVKKINRLT